MVNRYSIWRYVFLIGVMLFGILYALPNLYPEDPAIQISALSREVDVTKETEVQVKQALTEANINFKSASLSADDLTILFYDTDSQLQARDVIQAVLEEGYSAALTLAPATPAWMARIGAAPMKQGLDLRGGVHFLLEVDLDGVVARRIESIMRDISQNLREARIRYTQISSTDDHAIIIRFTDTVATKNAYVAIERNFIDLTVTWSDSANENTLRVRLLPSELRNIQQNTLDQTVSILRNRVNELGVAEAVVLQQGNNRVSVDLPGIQDAVRAKQILGGTATLEFRLVDIDGDAAAAQTSTVPMGSRVYTYQGQPVLLKNQVILSGDSIIGAVSSYDQQTASPAVSIQLGGGGESLFTRETRTNIGKPMAIVFVETKGSSELVDGEITYSSETSERVISVATIQSALGTNFQITGLTDQQEARDLALLLRAGALPAAIYPVEERTVGPTLGQENIQRGLISLEVGMAMVLLFMVLYYRVFGLIADIALCLNLIFLAAILSIIDATLTLPGIAGIVLTVGMAVDANVLIYERIREELRNGASPQAAIYTGYERAFGTIIDANVTTLIVALILFALGSGPVKGFAVTLSIGLLTSMFTAVAYTRGIVNLMYGRRSVKKLSIGI
ncbi:MAG: protein translocase subunit SecD [Gammaproteobacteria bacterium]